MLPGLHNVTNFMLRTITPGSPGLSWRHTGTGTRIFILPQQEAEHCSIINSYWVNKQIGTFVLFCIKLLKALNEDERMKDISQLRRSSILKLNAIKQSLKIGEIEKPKLQFRRVCKYFSLKVTITIFSLNESEKH